MSSIRLVPTRPRGSALTVDLVGDDVLTGGAGGWQDLERPLRRAAIEYVGTPGYIYELPLLFNGVEALPGVDVLVDGGCREIMRWGNRNRDTGQPQVLRLDGAVLKAPPSCRWVIDSIGWGESWRNSNGGRIQQFFMLTLKEFVEAEVLKSPAKASRDRRRGNGRNNSSTVGQTPGDFGYGTPDPGA